MLSRSATLVVCITFILSGTSWHRVQAQGADSSDALIRIGRSGSLYSAILEEDRPYWIHLPTDYDDNAATGYPVVYLLDGELHLGGLAAVQNYYNYFRLPEMIVVGVSNQNNRTRDLTPTTIEVRNGAAVEASGGAMAFRSFIADELIPHIDSKYRTTSHRVLIGHSLGGLFVIDTLLERPGLFKNYVALDPSLDWDEGKWLEESLTVLTNAPLFGHGLFVGISNEIVRFSDQLTLETVSTDSSPFSLGIRSQISFVEAQTQSSNGLFFSWKFYDEDIHGSVPLIGMRDGLVHLYDFWELKRPSLYNDPDTPIQDVVSLIREQSNARSANMGYPLPMELDLLEMLAYFYSNVGQMAKAKAVLAVTAEYYPESTSVHTALVDVCIELKDEECARQHAQKADNMMGGAEQRNKVTEEFGIRR